MTPVEIIRDAQGKKLIAPDGDSISLDLEPGLSTEQIDAFEKTLPCPLPANIRELLSFCRGFNCMYEVDFVGMGDELGLPEIFPHGHPIMRDGCGNYWVVDLKPYSKEWGPIYFACHDPSAILYQSPNLEEFLTELFRLHVPPHASAIDDVADDRIFNVWRENPGVMEQEEALTSGDEMLRQFANDLGPGWQFVDLRNAPVGMGFDWARYKVYFETRRCGYEPIFAYQKPGPRKGFLSGLFGKKA